MLQWRRYTAARFRLVALPEGDHYFVSTHFREVGGAAIMLDVFL